MIIQHLIKQSPSLCRPIMLKQHLQQNIASGRDHLKLPIKQRLVGIHSLLMLAPTEKPIHKGGIHNPIIHQAAFLKLIKELISLVQIPQIQEAGDQVVINQGIGTVAFVQHFSQKINGLADPTGIDQPFGQVPVGDR